MPTTVRISSEAHTKLKSLAAQSGESMPTVLERAIEAYRRQQLLEETNRAFQRLRDQPVEWQQELGERREWEATLADGLDPDDATEGDT